MKKISRRSFLAVCGAMAATAALTACGGSSASTAGTAASGSTAGAAASGEVFELKLSTTQTDTSMIYQGLQAAADKVAEDTDGHVKVTIYPSSQLGGEEDMIDQALQGMGIAVLTDAGRLSSYVNDIGIMNMAYIVDNYEDGMKLMATDTFKGWDADLANNGICGLCYNYYDGARSFMGHKAYKTPADLKGAVIRTPGADPYVESISAMGATPYNIAWSEVYNGIQTKSIDGLRSPVHLCCFQQDLRGLRVRQQDRAHQPVQHGHLRSGMVRQAARRVSGSHEEGLQRLRIQQCSGHHRCSG